MGKARKTGRSKTPESSTTQVPDFTEFLNLAARKPAKAASSKTEPQKPSNVKLRAAGIRLGKAKAAFDEALLDFALLIYDAGNQDWESFLSAMRNALTTWRIWE